MVPQFLVTVSCRMRRVYVDKRSLNFSNLVRIPYCSSKDSRYNRRCFQRSECAVYTPAANVRPKLAGVLRQSNQNKTMELSLLASRLIQPVPPSFI